MENRPTYGPPERSEVLMLRTTAVWTAPQGGPYFSTMFFAGTGSASATEAALAHRAFWTALAPFINPAYSVNVDDEIVELDVQTGAPTAVYTEATTAQAGTLNSQPLSFATQGLIRLLTPTFVGSRRVRGRMFVPGLTEDSTQGGKPDVTFMSNVNAALATWFGTIDPSAPLVVWSRPITGAGGRPGTQHEVDAVTIWDQFAVLRSRRD